MIKIIHQIYIQGFNSMPDNYKQYSELWREYHLDWEYMFWDDENLSLFISKEYPIFYDMFISLSWIKKSDFARLLLLHHFGGMYCDTDTVPVKNIEPLLIMFDYDKYDSLFSWETEDWGGVSWKTDPIMRNAHKYWREIWESVKLNVSNDNIEDIKQQILRQIGDEQFERALSKISSFDEDGNALDSNGDIVGFGIIGSAWFYSNNPKSNIFMEFINDAKDRVDVPVLEHFSTWYLTKWYLKNNKKYKINTVDWEYVLSSTVNPKSYLIHLYDFNWRSDNESLKPWQVY
jgi:hypothetical protein